MGLEKYKVEKSKGSKDYVNLEVWNHIVRVEKRKVGYFRAFTDQLLLDSLKEKIDKR